MPKCSVRECQSKQENRLTSNGFYTFPKDYRREKWIAACGKSVVNPDTGK